MKDLEETFEILDLFDPCFQTNEASIAFLVDHGFLPSVIPCNICRSHNSDEQMTISNCSSFLFKQIYRCPKKTCKSRLSLTNGFGFGNIRVEYFKVLRMFYCWTYNYTLYQAIGLCKVSENTYITLKDLILEKFGEEPEDEIKIGGEDIRVQLDETAICNGMIISNPSSTYDVIPGVQWILGGVVEGNCREFFMEIVPNRRADTIEDLLKRRVKTGTVCITDGYPSYPSAVKNFGSIHEVVNHSIGFVNPQGGHTNQIENLWSHFKQEYRSRSGLNHDRIPLFLKEFIWKKRNLKYDDQDSIRKGFIKVLYMFLPNK